MRVGIPVIGSIKLKFIGFIRIEIGVQTLLDNFGFVLLLEGYNSWMAVDHSDFSFSGPLIYAITKALEIDLRAFQRASLRSTAYSAPRKVRSRTFKWLQRLCRLLLLALSSRRRTLG